jgi:REP element-mobilizing transposase RayT
MAIGTGTFTRRNLPHIYYPEGTYFITYRLHDSIPINLITELKKKYENSYEEPSIREKRIFKKYDELLDKGCSLEGNINLTDPAIAKINQQVIHQYDGKDYTLVCYCIMPNHIHLVFTLLEENRGISKIMKSIKGVSAREYNKHMGKSGIVWQDESYDHIVRNEKELFNIIRYVINNPVKANFVTTWQNWEWTYVAQNSFCAPFYEDGNI